MGRIQLLHADGLHEFMLFTAQALVIASYEGSYTISALGVNKVTMEEVARQSMATQFNLSPDHVQVTVTETRRLSEDVRRLAGVFAITFEITVPAAEAAAVTAKVEAARADQETFKTEFASVAVEKLKEAGVEEAKLEGIQARPRGGTAVCD